MTAAVVALLGNFILISLIFNDNIDIGPGRTLKKSGVRLRRNSQLNIFISV